MNSFLVKIPQIFSKDTSAEYQTCKKIALQIRRKVSPVYASCEKKYLEELSNDIFSEGVAPKIKWITADLKDSDEIGLAQYFIKKFSEIKTPKAFWKFFDNFDDIYMKSKKKFLKEQKNYSQSDVPFLCKKSDEFAAQALFILSRLFAPKTTSPKVLKIEKKLKELGVQESRLGNSEKFAKRVLAAVKDLKAHKELIPNRIFVSNYIEPHRIVRGVSVSCAQENFVQFESNRLKNLYSSYCGAIQSELENSKAYNNLPEFMKRVVRIMLGDFQFSSKSPKHLINHEFGHVNAPIGLPGISFNQLSEKDQLTVFKLTEYIQTEDILGECFAELFAKIKTKGIMSLTEDEYNLLKRIYTEFPNRSMCD